MSLLHDHLVNNSSFSITSLCLDIFHQGLLVGYDDSQIQDGKIWSLRMHIDSRIPQCA